MSNISFILLWRLVKFLFLTISTVVDYDLIKHIRVL